jgi:hypothetical protein
MRRDVWLRATENNRTESDGESSRASAGSKLTGAIFGNVRAIKSSVGKPYQTTQALGSKDVHITHINCVGDGTTPGNFPDFTQQLLQAAFVISQPYKSDQESCCQKALQNLKFPFIVNTSSSFNVLSSIALIKQ